MALHRGIQSAIFFYLSCAPCTGYSYRKKRRREATRDRVAKQAMEEEQPGLYRHPSPFATNPHWQTEIDLGPTLLTSKRRAKDGHKKGRTRTSDENASNVTSSLNLPLTQGDSNDSNWNLRHWQREDEDLWGADYSHNSASRSTLRPSTTNATPTSTVTRPLTARTTTTERSAASSYQSTMNPPINDLHPAIVTRIDSRSDAMWMLQPPPPARVMRGTQQVNPDRRPSAASRPASRKANTMQQANQRTVLSPSCETLVAAHDTKTSSDNLSQKRRRRPSPISVSEDVPPALQAPLLIEPSQTHSDLESPPFVQILSPVVSADPSVRSRSRSRSRTRGRSTDNRRPPANKRQDSSLNVLQELVPPNTLLNVQRLNKSPSFEARIELPSADDYEEIMLLGSGKAGFESWYDSKDFATFPQWAADRVQRHVSTRWSVDF